MNRIAITGSTATGKTTVSLILSHLTGFLHLLPKTDYETSRALIQYGNDQDQFYSCFMNCMFKLSDRLKNEALAENCFISDGCIFNEVAYLKAFHVTLTPGLANSKKVKEQSLMIQSIENAVSYYFRSRYDEIIFLNRKSQPDSGLSTTDQFSAVYGSCLYEMLQQSGQPFSIFQVDNLELAISQIVEEKNLERRLSVKEAIYRAQRNLHHIDTYLSPAKLN